MPRLALLVNIVAPYRHPVYEQLACHFDVRVLLSGVEDNRTTWSQGSKLAPSYRVKRSRGITLRHTIRVGKRIVDQHYLHLTPGYLLDLMRLRPDAVVSIEMGARSLIALTYGALLRKPVWIWWGGTTHTERSRSPFKRAIRRVIGRWCRHWISYGQTSTEYLISLGIPRERILQIQNCVDETYYAQPVEPALGLDPRPVVLCVGQLIGRKGVTLLLEAAARAQRNGGRFTLLLVGDGPERRNLEANAHELGLQHVHFHPAQPPEKMPSIYRSADCLVFPTLEDVWGLVVNEALWSGLPVLSSIYAGCTPEIVPPENRFDPLNPADFDRAFRLILEEKLSPPDTSSLKTCREVADLIVADIQRVLNR